MPGKQVKNWRQYEALRRKGFKKSSAARITNASVKRRRAKARSRKKSRARRRRRRR